MARKILNRKELRVETEAAERLQAEKETTTETTETTEPKAKKKKAAKPKSRSKAAKEVRLKAYWGVFNHSARRVALFEYHQRAEADKKAAELTVPDKDLHFVQLVKEVIEE
jgi:hypothetical protein